MIEVIDAGPQTTVQDLGRHGHQRYGIPTAGAIDRYSSILANRLVGNVDNAALLECTLRGPQFQVQTHCALAVTGATVNVSINDVDVPRWSTLFVREGDVVKIGSARSGVRAYVAFAGGIDVPLVMGSRSTYLRGGVGGFSGRALRKGDRISLFAAAMPRAWRLDSRRCPNFDHQDALRVVLGPQADRFTAHGIASFLESSYQVLPQSDRMGVRLHGACIEHAHGHDVISDGIALGSVQVPGDGQPIVLLVDRQSTGGYTKLATVCSFDIGRIGQMRPGQMLRFQAVAVDEAHRLAREAESSMAGLFPSEAP
jgi:antagonist of KipI